MFGVGASEQLGAKVEELGCTKVICIYDKGIQEAGLIDPLIDNMKAAGLDVIQYDGVLAEKAIELTYTPIPNRTPIHIHIILGQSNSQDVVVKQPGIQMDLSDCNAELWSEF